MRRLFVAAIGVLAMFNTYLGLKRPAVVVPPYHVTNKVFVGDYVIGAMCYEGPVWAAREDGSCYAADKPK